MKRRDYSQRHTYDMGIPSSTSSLDPFLKMQFISILESLVPKPKRRNTISKRLLRLSVDTFAGVMASSGRCLCTSPCPDFDVIWPLNKVFITIAVIKSVTPTRCCGVHLFWKRAKLRKSVVPFRAVDVKAMLKQPNRFVMAPKQLAPMIPDVENRKSTTAFSGMLQVNSVAPYSISGIVPGRSRNMSRPSSNSCRQWAATSVAMRLTTYRRE